MLLTSAQIKNIKKSTQKGFTLVELLIVIAVLGVLAAVVLVAINPIEQLNRGNDAGRESSVSQLGRAILAFQTSQQQPDYTTLSTAITAATWQTSLVNAGEIKNIISVNQGSNVCTAGKQGFVCAAATGVASVQIWTDLTSTAEWTRAGCTGAQIAAAIWDSSQGRQGVGCLTNATAVPAQGILLK